MSEWMFALLVAIGSVTVSIATFWIALELIDMACWSKTRPKKRRKTEHPLW